MATGEFMKPKMIEAGQPIKVGELSLTILLELEAGRDKRIYKVKDQRGALYVYKHCKRRTIKKEISRAEALTRIGLLHSKVIASGSDFILRSWIAGTRGDDWLKSWESFGAPMDVDAVEKLVSLFDKSSRAGMYVGHLDPDDLVWDGSDWWILDCGGIISLEPRAVASRYFWKVFTRWGSKLDRHRKSLANLLQVLSSLGKDYTAVVKSVAPVTGKVQTRDAYTEAKEEEHDDPPSSGNTDDDDDDDSSGELPDSENGDVEELLPAPRDAFVVAEDVLAPTEPAILPNYNPNEIK